MQPSRTNITRPIHLLLALIILFAVPGAPALAESTTIVGCGDTTGLVAAIHAANNENVRPGPDVIELTAGCFYNLSAIDNYGYYNANGLPKITSAITIQGHGAVIQRSGPTPGADFRAFDVSAGGALLLRHVTIRQMGGPAVWGGAVINDGTLTIEESTLEGNLGLYGGAIFNKGPLKITRSTLANNIVPELIGAGGAIYHAFDADLLEVENSTIAANMAPGSVAMQLWAAAKITSSTIAGNIPTPGTTGAPSAIMVLSSGSLALGNTILANDGLAANCATQNQNPALITDLGGNVQSRGTSCGAAMLIGDPLLAPLMENGGPTQTMALWAGSPAAGMGLAPFCPAIDQRGAARPNPPGTSCDAGAFERGGITVALTAAPGAVEPGKPASVKINLQNDSGQPVSQLAASGALPAGLAIAGSQPSTSTCGGSFQAAPGGAAFQLSGGALEIREGCALTFPVTGSVPGEYWIRIEAASTVETGPLPAANPARLVINPHRLFLVLVQRP